MIAFLILLLGKLGFRKQNFPISQSYDVARAISRAWIQTLEYLT